MVQSYADPLTRQDVAPLKEEEDTRFLEVNICSLDPALVLKLGVTVKEIELSPVCMDVNLFVYDSDPVRRVT